MAFTWIPFYKEFSQKLMQFREDRTPLIDWIYDNLQGHISHLKDAPDGKRVADVDPFTVLAIINRGISFEKKVTICKKFKNFLHISTPVPDDFNGVPEMNTQRSNFMGFELDRKEGDIERLWRVFEDAIFDKEIKESYDALNGQFLIKFNITIGLFWVRPDRYLPLDEKSQSLLSSLGITFDRRKFLPYEEYARVMQELKEKMESQQLGYSTFAEFSNEAYQQKETVKKPKEKPEVNSKSIAYWTYSPGPQASKWKECQEKGIMCIGWDSLGDLSKYSSREEMAKELKSRFSVSGSAKNDSLAVWQFANELKPGDVVFAKNGMTKIIGRGVVASDYTYDASRSEYKHVRKIDWTLVGEWKTEDKHAMKTLTNVSRYTDYVDYLNKLVSGKTISDTPGPNEGQQYWWLVANPKIWSITNIIVGGEQTYTLYNESGHPRRILQNFLSAKQGDIIVGYESTPTKQIVGLLEVSKANDGTSICFKKTEALKTPIDFSVIKSDPDLAGMEYLRNPQGSFFKLTSDEYDAIIDLIRGENPLPKKESKEKYTIDKFLEEVFLSKKDYKQLTGLLLRKKNLILQGAPGVGKTFAAKRLAYAMMGEKDEERVLQVQFHQNYSYEDFVMGYKPNEEGGFELKNGIFYRFCKKAATDGDHKYFFIIDEINRGNLSKIFGELLMLIENDYREKPIRMSYRDEEFSVPDNLYIIGMMNTADRSLAMIDYALRRRFSFFEMKPGFNNPVFQDEIKKQLDPHLEHLVQALIEVNNDIENDDSLGSGFCIGHSYLCNLGSTYDLESIVEYDIIPMLREYWFDNETKFSQEAQKLRNALK